MRCLSLAHDPLFNGIKALYRFDAGSGVGLTIDRLSFDFERPPSLLGIAQDKSLVSTDLGPGSRS